MIRAERCSALRTQGTFAKVSIRENNRWKSLSTEAGVRPTSFAPTQVSFAATNNQSQINWLADHTGLRLQSQTNNLAVGLGTNWVYVSGSALTNKVPLPLNPTNGAVFFRLVRPY